MQFEETILTIDLIPTDTLATMTVEMHHLFNVNGCNPTCHCCGNPIGVDTQYKLGSVSRKILVQASKLDGYAIFKSKEPHDVMLCGNVKCTPEMMVLNHVAKLKSYKDAIYTDYGGRRGGCSIIDGKIVP